jgi:mersacidin/lichenicidin family type 2 lantibiotic
MVANENIVRALRDPEYRASLKGEFIHPSGEVSNEELKAVIGGSDVSPETTIPCTIIILTIVKCWILSTDCLNKPQNFHTKESRLFCLFASCPFTAEINKKWIYDEVYEDETSRANHSCIKRFGVPRSIRHRYDPSIWRSIE